jgi:hypothetical protein
MPSVFVAQADVMFILKPTVLRASLPMQSHAFRKPQISCSLGAGVKGKGQAATLLKMDAA